MKLLMGKVDNVVAAFRELDNALAHFRSSDLPYHADGEAKHKRGLHWPVETS